MHEGYGTSSLRARAGGLLSCVILFHAGDVTAAPLVGQRHFRWLDDADAALVAEDTPVAVTAGQQLHLRLGLEAQGFRWELGLGDPAPVTVTTSAHAGATGVEQQRKLFRNPRGQRYYYLWARSGVRTWTPYKSADGVTWGVAGADIVTGSVEVVDQPDPVSVWLWEDNANARTVVWVAYNYLDGVSGTESVSLACFAINDAGSDLSELYTSVVGVQTDDGVHFPAVTLAGNGLVWVSWVDEYTDRGKQRVDIYAAATTTPQPTTPPTWSAAEMLWTGVDSDAGSNIARTELVPLTGATADVGIIYAYFDSAASAWRLRAQTGSYAGSGQPTFGAQATLPDLASPPTYASVPESGPTGDVFVAHARPGGILKVQRWNVTSNALEEFGATSLYPGPLDSLSLAIDQTANPDRLHVFYYPNDKFDSYEEDGDNTNLGLAAGSYARRLAQRVVYSQPRTIAGLAFMIGRAGSPTGSAYLRVRRVSNDAVLGEVMFDAASVPQPGSAWFYRALSSPVEVPANTAVRFSIEFSGGDGGNYLNVRADTTLLTHPGTLDRFGGSWTPETRDLEFQAFLAPGKIEYRTSSIDVAAWSGTHAIVDGNEALGSLTSAFQDWQGTSTIPLAYTRQSSLAVRFVDLAPAGFLALERDTNPAFSAPSPVTNGELWDDPDHVANGTLAPSEERLATTTVRQIWIESRPHAAANETMVPAGGLGEWDFAITAPSAGGLYYYRAVITDPSGTRIGELSSYDALATLTVGADDTPPESFVITSVATDPSEPYEDTTDESPNTTTVLFAVVGATNCHWDTQDVAYSAMTHDCASTTSCTFTDAVANSVDYTYFIACIDAAANENGPSDNLDVTWRNVFTICQVTGPDDDCNGLDENCNGAIDENYAPDSSCFLPGVCASGNVASSCSSGGVLTPCATGAATGADDNCNGLDEDCSGSPDDNYVPPVSACGVGVCAATGALTCIGGATNDTCAPGPVTGPDEDCNNLDEDCSGAADDHYVADASCFLPGVCASGNIASSCAGGVETPCATGAPTGDDNTCNGEDDNCDGFIDEAVDFAVACPPSDVCEIAVCSPSNGACEASDTSLCCTGDLDCAVSSWCWQTSCVTSTTSCMFTPVAGCCTVDADCDDGQACTENPCAADTGLCGSHWIQGCCATNADCDDGDDCSYDECTAVARCQHRPVSCATASPCGADTNCILSSLYLSQGPFTPPTARVAGRERVVVMQLAITGEALAGRLEALHLQASPAPLMQPDVWLLTAELFADANGHGVLDASSELLGRAPVDSETGAITFDDLDYRIEQAATQHVLVTMRKEPAPLSTGTVMPSSSNPLVECGLWMLASVLALLLAHGRRPRWRRAFAVAAIACLIAACGRSGFYRSVELRIAIELNDNVRMSADPPLGANGERLELWVQGAPLESAPFEVWW